MLKIKDSIIYCYHCFFFKQKLTDVVKEAGRDSIPIKCPVCREEEDHIKGSELKELIPSLWAYLGCYVITEKLNKPRDLCTNCSIEPQEYFVEAGTRLQESQYLCKDCMDNGLDMAMFSVLQVTKS